MNKTSALVGIVAGLTGAGFAYGFKSRDTTKSKGVANLEGNTNVLSPPVRIASELETNYETAIEKSREYVRRFRDEVGIPGVVVGVSVDGRTIWEEGFGYANIETRTPCHADTVMRIASISKPITMALLAKLCEMKKIDLDKSVHEYVTYFPRKIVDGEPVDITIRQLASHTSGVRHYRKKGEKKEDSRDSGAEFYLKEKFDSIEKSVDLFKNDELLFKPDFLAIWSTQPFGNKGKYFTRVDFEYCRQIYICVPIPAHPRDMNEPALYYLNKQGTILNFGSGTPFRKTGTGSDARSPNFYPLSGTAFEYTTHGYTLLSAVIESAGKKPFTEQIQEFFKLLGLEHTQLDKIQKIIYGRACFYDKDKHGRILNAELADTSYKWAGGGLVSTVGDLVKFGNAMLYCYQQSIKDKPGYLKKETVQEMWKIVDLTTKKWGPHSGYGLGWTIFPKESEIGGVTKHQKFHVGHAGAAVGSSSILMIFPRENNTKYDENNNEIISKLPQGVTVAILVNLENVSCKVLGENIAEEFHKVK